MDAEWDKLLDYLEENELSEEEVIHLKIDGLVDAGKTAEAWEYIWVLYESGSIPKEGVLNWLNGQKSFKEVSKEWNKPFNEISACTFLARNQWETISHSNNPDPLDLGAFSYYLDQAYKDLQ